MLNVVDIALRIFENPKTHFKEFKFTIKQNKGLEFIKVLMTTYFYHKRLVLVHYYSLCKKNDSIDFDKENISGLHELTCIYTTEEFNLTDLILVYVVSSLHESKFLMIKFKTRLRTSVTIYNYSNQSNSSKKKITLFRLIAFAFEVFVAYFIHNNLINTLVIYKTIFFHVFLLPSYTFISNHLCYEVRYHSAAGIVLTRIHVKGRPLVVSLLDSLLTRTRFCYIWFRNGGDPQSLVNFGCDIFSNAPPYSSWLSLLCLGEYSRFVWKITSLFRVVVTRSMSISPPLDLVRSDCPTDTLHPSLSLL